MFLHGSVCGEKITPEMAVKVASVKKPKTYFVFVGL
jgi:hypothetical protein